MNALSQIYPNIGIDSSKYLEGMITNFFTNKYIFIKMFKKATPSTLLRKVEDNILTNLPVTIILIL